MPTNTPLTALVTGGSSGMGLEYCRQLAQRGCHVLMVSNQLDLLESLPAQLSEEYGVPVMGHYQDLADDHAALFREAPDRRRLLVGDRGGMRQDEGLRRCPIQLTLLDLGV